MAVADALELNLDGDNGGSDELGDGGGGGAGGANVYFVGGMGWIIDQARGRQRWLWRC